MSKFTAVNKKNGQEVTVVELESGRFEVTAQDGSVKEVAPSTFKRWFKKAEAVVESTPVVTEQDAIESADHQAFYASNRGSKTVKITTVIKFSDVDLHITEYNGYVCDVLVVVPGTTNVIYRSAKMSIKDALTHLGFEGDQLKSARRVIMDARKAAKQAL